MRIAVIGAGVSGMTAAYLLHGDHAVTLFEAEDHVGGHAWTVPVETRHGTFAVDVGFMVYNEVTYPKFSAMLRRFEVETKPTSMSFSVRCHRTGLEYAGTSLDTVFAQRRNLLRPWFLRMLAEILRFNREAPRLLEAGIEAPTLGEWLDRNRYSERFRRYYLYPMGAAIWSSSPRSLPEFPAGLFVRFFHNHGLLTVGRHHQWRVVHGGARRYVEALTRPFADRIRVSTPVRAVVRYADRVEVVTNARGAEPFDHVVLATHADQALKLLAEPTRAEREILSALPYRVNDAVLHTDPSLLPVSARARASWNYHVPEQGADRVLVTYDLTRLQGLESPEPICLTLNGEDRVARSRVSRRIRFEHPVFTPDSERAKARFGEISGVDRTHFCGAYWRNGFHEDGVHSAVEACRALVGPAERDGQQLHLRRTRPSPAVLAGDA